MGALDGRVAVVTGASRGWGRAIARGLAREGAAVAVVARTEQVWDERLPGTIFATVDEIESAGGTAVAIRADLLVPEDRVRLIDEARAALGPITLLVNNAAFTAPGRPPAAGAEGAKRAVPPAAPGGSPAPAGSSPEASRPEPSTLAKAEWPTFLTTRLAAYERHFTIGPFASYELMQLVVPDMVAAGYGAIVNISSGASRMPGEGPYPDRSEGVLAGYGGSKAALEHLTECAAYDLVDSNIAVNSLSPSKAILTPGVNYYVKEFGDVGSEDDFARAVVILASAQPDVLTGRILGHLDVLDGSFRPYEYRGGAKRR